MKKENGKIESIKLKTFGDKAFWHITIVDMEGNEIGTFGNIFLSDSVSFREQTFGLMQILNNYKLLALDGEDRKYPIYVDDSKYFISCIANENGDYLDIDPNNHMPISYGTGKDISKFNKRELSGFKSGSGCLLANTRADHFTQGLLIDGVYFGCRGLYGPVKSEDVETAEICADNFRNAICGIMNVCNEKDLIKSDNYPEVTVQLDEENNITAIGSKDERLYLAFTGEGYEVMDGSTFDSKQDQAIKILNLVNRLTELR